MGKKELHEKYGELLIQAEILQAQITSVKNLIVQEYNKKEEVLPEKKK